MAGVLIYANALKQHVSFVTADNKTYTVIKADLLEDKSIEIIWEKENVNLQKIEDSRITRADLVRKLNEGQKVNLEKELSKYFN